jgi:hypothetical protein
MALVVTDNDEVFDLLADAAPVEPQQTQRSHKVSFLSPTSGFSAHVSEFDGLQVRSPRAASVALPSAEAALALAGQAAAALHWRRSVPRSHTVFRLELSLRDVQAPTKPGRSASAAAAAAAVDSLTVCLDVICAAAYGRRSIPGASGACLS